MARTSSSGAGGSSSNAQGRFVVSLPKELGDVIDAIGVKLTEALRRDHGVGVELNRAQIVTSLVKSAMAGMEDAVAGAESNGAGEESATPAAA